MPAAREASPRLTMRRLTVGQRALAFGRLRGRWGTFLRLGAREINRRRGGPACACPVQTNGQKRNRRAAPKGWLRGPAGERRLEGRRQGKHPTRDQVSPRQQ